MTLAARDLALPGRLDGIGLSFRRHELTAICGPNGAGKSSLLASLAGLEPEALRAVALEGRSLADWPARERARAIGYLPQQGEVAWDVTVETLVALGRLPWPDAPPEQAARAMDAALAAMDLADLRHRPLSRLSGGERARALLARVLATGPRWLLADEPLANLDLAHAASLMRRLRARAADGAGVVVVLHDLAAAINHADRVVVLDGGRIAAEGAPGLALSPEVIARVWGVRARWLGEPGALALAVEV